jgi:hypothetical protein
LEKSLCEGKNPLHCAHSSIVRVIDTYRCVDCGAEFVPKNPKHATKWSDDPGVWVPNPLELKQLQG